MPDPTPQPDQKAPARLEYAEVCRNMEHEGFRAVLKDDLHRNPFEDMLLAAKKRTHRPCPACNRHLRHPYFWMAPATCITRTFIKCQECGHMEQL